MKTWAILKDNIVKNKTIGIISHHSEGHECIDITDKPYVDIGMVHSNGEFFHPKKEIIKKFPGEYKWVLSTNLGNFEVSVKNGIASAGCAQYDAEELISSLEKIVKENTFNVGPFSITDVNLSFLGGSVQIKVEDLKQSLRELGLGE